MKRFISAAILSMSSILFVNSSAQALPCDDRGSNWQGQIQIGSSFWGFELRRLTCAPTSPWNYYMANRRTGARMAGQATVAMSGRSLIVTPFTGAATGCTLNGTWAPRDVINGRSYRGSGTATCGGPTGVWRAAIR